jgi:hypothetical protein
MSDEISLKSMTKTVSEQDGTVVGAIGVLDTPVSAEDQDLIKKREEALKRDTDSPRSPALRPSFPLKTTRDGKLTYGENQLRLAEALTGHGGERAIQVLAEIVITFFGDPQKVLDSVPAELPEWSRG